MNMLPTLSKRIVLWLSCAVLLASCSLPGSGAATGGALVWLDQPTTNSLLPLAPFALKAHARPGTAGGVTRIEFLVNDVAVGSVDTDASLPLVNAETSWNPSANGSYTISAQAFAGNGSTLSEIATVCVSDKVTSASAGFGGDCANPIAGGGAAITDTPAAGGPSTPTTLPPITVVANVNDNPVYYGTCDPHFLTVKANLSGDLSSFDAVRVSWVYDTVAGTSPFGLGDVPFDHNEMTVQPDGSYLWSSDLNTASAGWGLTGEPYMIYVYVTAWDSSWHGLGFAGPIPVRWLPCSSGSGPTPTFTHAPVVIPTNTSVPPADTTPPSVTITQINPSDTGYYYTGCGPNSITVQAQVTDASGLSSVTLTYQYSTGTSASLAMTSLGGGTYQAVLPLDINTYNALHGVNGTVSFTVSATDTRSNTATASGGPVTLMYCPG
jgi:hypothetical protein